jgi:hypothetical protein
MSISLGSRLVESSDFRKLFLSRVDQNAGPDSLGTIEGLEMAFIEELQKLTLPDAAIREALQQCAGEIWFAESPERVERLGKILAGRVLKCLDPVEALAEGMDAWVLGVVSRKNGRGQKPLPPPSPGFAGLSEGTASGLATAQAAYRAGLALRIDLLEAGHQELDEWLSQQYERAGPAKLVLRARFGRLREVIEDKVSEVVVELHTALRNGMIVANWAELESKLVGWAANRLRDEIRRQRPLHQLDEKSSNRHGTVPEWDASMDLEKIIDRLGSAPVREAFRQLLEGAAPQAIREDLQLTESEWRGYRRKIEKMRGALANERSKTEGEGR